MKYLYLNLCLIVSAYATGSTKYTITTKNGAVEGTKETTEHTSKTYYAFRGIPFAEPPIGKLRFEPPVAIQNWSNTLDATKQKDVCVHHFTASVKTIKLLGKEDCLYLNVYTPVFSVDKCPNKPLAVMVWIHGGGFMEGDTTDELYTPDYLVNEDVLVVKIAYRLNFLGFLSTGDLKYPGNNGLKDQIMGLKWVKDNIDAFGGDPDRITIFGESAGAASVSYLTQTPLTKGLYSGAVMQSGSSLCPWAISTRTSDVLLHTGALLGINENSPGDLVEKLKTVDYKDLYAASMVASNRIFGSFPIGGLANGPVIEPEHPNAVVTRSSYEKLISGDFNLTPLMLGFNTMEAVDFQPIVEINRLYLLRIKLEHSGFTPPNFNIEDEILKDTVGELIKRYYFGDANATFTDMQILRYIGDHYFVRDILKAAQITSSYTNSFLYQFSHLGNLGNPLRPYDYGVGHAEDLNYLFGRVTTLEKLDASDAVVRDIMVRIWTNFAKYGNPTPFEDPLLQNIIWPKSSANFEYLDIQENLSVGTHPREDDYKFWADLYEKYRQNV